MDMYMDTGASRANLVSLLDAPLADEFKWQEPIFEALDRLILSRLVLPDEDEICVPILLHYAMRMAERQSADLFRALQQDRVEAAIEAMRTALANGQAAMEPVPAVGRPAFRGENFAVALPRAVEGSQWTVQLSTVELREVGWWPLGARTSSYEECTWPLVIGHRHALNRFLERSTQFKTVREARAVGPQAAEKAAQTVVRSLFDLARNSTALFLAMFVATKDPRLRADPPDTRSLVQTLLPAPGGAWIVRFIGIPEETKRPFFFSPLLPDVRTFLPSYMLDDRKRAILDRTRRLVQVPMSAYALRHSDEERGDAMQAQFEVFRDTRYFDPDEAVMPQLFGPAPRKDAR